jgi:hypothetical protein
MARIISYLFTSLSVLPIFFVSSVVQAQSSMLTIVTGQPSQYILTMEKLELCAAGSRIDPTGNTAPTCVNPYVLGNSNLAFDMASVSAGAQVGTYAQISANNWPAGTTFTHIRATMLRTKTITAKIAITGPSSGYCVTGTPGGGTVASGTTISQGKGSVSGSPSIAATPSAVTIWEQSAGSPFGNSQAQLYQNGQVDLSDGVSYTQVAPLTAPYTATRIPPSMTLSWDMATAVQVDWFPPGQGNCQTAGSGGNGTCCFTGGPINVHVTLQ